ncbi:MAG: SGNH/GDSL hydrolase family protein [Planctomycetota bacterium]|jgi:hypothetical protein
MRRARRLLHRLLALSLGTLAVLLVGEVFVRLVDPFGVSNFRNQRKYRQELMELDLSSPRLFRHRRDRRLDLYGFEIRTDSRGLRGPERASPKPSDRRRLLVLGDSVALGWGVPEEQTFVRLAEPLLAELTGESWECVNAGHLFHDTVQEAEVLREVGFAYEPDIVALVFVDNDLALSSSLLSAAPVERTPEAQAAVDRARTLGRIQPYLPGLHSLGQFLLTRLSAADRIGTVQAAEVAGADMDAVWLAVATALEQMAADCAERGVRFGVLDYYHQLPLEEFVAERGWPYASIAFSDEELASGVRLSAADAHANPRGHRYLAEHLVEALDGLGLLE